MSTTSPVNAPRIMIVDDNQMMRAFLSNFLAKRGFQLSTARNGAEALTILHKGHFPDLIIADLHMPIMDGMAMLERMQASPMLSEIPVLVLSGSEESEDRIHALERGAVDILAKPFNPIELELRVRRYLPATQQLGRMANG
jgi:DNA-binding response OmpR family regulator